MILAYIVKVIFLNQKSQKTLQKKRQSRNEEIVIISVMIKLFMHDGIFRLFNI